MRSPAAFSTQSWYCASCDATKNTPNDTTDASSSTSSVSANESLDHISRPSTPPTEVSSTFSSPIFAPVDTEEILRRRQQSDQASVEIGKRMLKGWAMLADECPNSECFGIPLVRPPKPGGGKDPRKASSNTCEAGLYCNLHLSSNASFVTQHGLIPQTVVLAFDSILVNPRPLQLLVPLAS